LTISIFAEIISIWLSIEKKDDMTYNFALHKNYQHIHSAKNKNKYLYIKKGGGK